MNDELVHEILRKTEQALELYYRLVLVVSVPEKDSSAVFNKIAEQSGIQLVNVNRELSEKMLTLTARQRSLRAEDLLSDIVAVGNTDTVLLEHTEILFDPSLQIDPLRVLQNLSRRKTVIASWKGQIQGTYLTYAEPDHPESQRYPTKDLVLIHWE